jgi:phage terminase large subunit-like protein
MRSLLSKLRKYKKIPGWTDDRQNMQFANIIIKRSTELFYQFLPYFNRRDGKPGWQWDFLEAAANHKGRVALGGNRIGKSDMGAYECMLAVTGRHPYREFPAEGEGWIVGLDFNMVKTVDLPKFRKFIPSSFEKHFTSRDNQPVYELWNDERKWTVRFKSSEAGRAKFQGAEVDFIWFDEEPQRTDIFSECEARLIDRAGVWWMTATPILGTIWLKHLSERSDVFSNINSGVAMWDNPYLPEDEIQKLADQWDDEERLVRIEGNYIVFGGKPVFNVVELTALLEKVKQGPAPEEGELRLIA